MSCAGLTGLDKKNCLKKQRAAANKKKDEEAKKALNKKNKKSSDDFKKSVADLSNIKNKFKYKVRKRNPDSNPQTSSASKTGFGGSKLGKGTRLQRKKGNRSKR